MGFGPQLVDLDADGHLDLISGSWPGEIFLFRGKPGRDFEKPVMIRDKEGNYINIGGGMRGEIGDGMLLIAGHAEFKQDEKGQQYIEYHGKRIDFPKGKQVGITGTASAVNACDWDGDGDLDLIVGEIRGRLYLVPNEGTPQAYAFGKEMEIEADGNAIQVNGDAGPFTVDWDGDGDLDLICGDGAGQVTLFRNLGKEKEPRLGKGEILVARTGADGDGKPPREAKPGMRAKVCARDYDGDGDVDLLVGDYATLLPEKPEPTGEEKAKLDRLREEREKVRERLSEASGAAYGPQAKDLSEAERKAKEEDYRMLIERYQALTREIGDLPENHGWVWLYQRVKVAGAGASGAGGRER